MIKVGSDFSGVGAFNQALMRLGIDYEEIFACDMDKYARQTYIHNYGEPKYYPKNVYEREIPSESLDIYMTSPPCQAFSLAGKRLGKDDKRGILFFNSHEFIQKNKPRYFIFENVKGLLSSKNGLQYENILYLCLYNFQKIEQWQNLNTQKNNLNLLSQTLAPYLYMNWSKKLGLKRTKCGTSFISNSELNYEKLGKIVGSGLKRRLKFLETRICQITKKPNYCHVEQIVQFGCKEEDLVLNQEKFYLIENLFPKAISILEKTVDINVNTSLFANPLLEENSKKGKLYTMLMELNSTTDPRIFMYVIEMNIIRLIILALDLSSNLWERIWHILIGKQAFIGLKTFDEWLFMLDHLNYHIYWKVINAKDFNVPQNRERVFIVGIRDDEDNNFSWAIEQPLTRKLKDVLEEEVFEKYYLSEKMVNVLKHHKNPIVKNETPDKSATIHAGYFKMGGRDQQYLKIGTWRTHKDGNGFREIKDGNSPTIPARSREDGSGQPVIKIKSATPKGYEEATEGDSVNFQNKNSKTRRGRVGKDVAQTLDTGCEQAVIIGYTRDAKGKVVSRNVWEQAGTIHTSSGSGGNTDQFVIQYSDKRLNETIAKNKLPEGEQRILDTYNKSVHEECPTLKKHHAENGDRKLWDGYKIRRLTPRECFRLMDFPDTFTWEVSDSQAYKQAGNSIVVAVLASIINKLNLCQR